MGSDNGSSPNPNKAIIWTNADLLLIGRLWHTSLKFEANYNNCQSRKWDGEYRLRSGGHLSHVNWCWCWSYLRHRSIILECTYQCRGMDPTSWPLYWGQHSEWHRGIRRNDQRWTSNNWWHPHRHLGQDIRQFEFDHNWRMSGQWHRANSSKRL